MSLVVSVEPKTDESAFGFYRRLAVSNGCVNLKGLRDLKSIDGGDKVLVSFPDLTAAALGLSESLTREMSERHTELLSWRGFARLNSDAICTACIAVDPYQKQQWLHGLTNVCEIHQCALIDQCPGCGDRLFSGRDTFTRCDKCFVDLKNHQVEPASSGELWAFALLFQKKMKLPSGFAPVPRISDVKQVTKLIRILCLEFGDLVVNGLRGNGNQIKAVEQSKMFLSPLTELLSDWPKNYHAAVRQRLLTAPASARTLSSALGSWFKELRKTANGTTLEIFVQQVEELNQREFDYVGGNSRLQSSKLSNSLTTKQAAELLGIGKDFLLKNAKSGRVTAKTSLTGTNGALYEFDRSTIDKLKETRATWISKEDACGRLVIPMSVLETLILAKVINSDAKWRTDIFKGGPIELRSIETFEQSVRASCENAPRTEEIIYVRDLTSKKTGEKKALVDLIKALATGVIKPSSTGSSLGDFALSKKVVAGYFGMPVIHSGLLVSEVGSLMGWKDECIRFWIDQGLLGSTAVLRRGQRCRVVMPSDLALFMKDYKPLTDVAKLLATTPKALTKKLEGRVQLLGAKVEKDSVRRGILIRTEDIYKLALKSIETGGQTALFN